MWHGMCVCVCGMVCARALCVRALIALCVYVCVCAGGGGGRTTVLDFILSNDRLHGSLIVNKYTSHV